jgi:hypothetical protein
MIIPPHMKSTPLSKADVEAIRSAESRLQDTTVRSSVRDLFALGLYLRATGHASEGHKACSQALRTLVLSETRTSRILKHLDDDPVSLSLSFQPHVEFQRLIEHELQCA